MRGKRRNMLVGAVVGAVLVALLAGLLGEWIRSIAHPAILIAFVVVGAVLGAYACGVEAYEREHEPDEPSTGYREGVLAEPERESRLAG